MIDKKTLDSKEVREKNARKLALRVYIFFCSFVFLYCLINLYLGLYYSAIANIYLAFGLIVGALFFIKRKKYFLGNFIMFITLTSYVGISIYIEGIMAGYHLFYLTMVFGVPLLVSQGREKFKKQSIFTYCVVIVSIIITSIVSPLYSEVYDISTSLTHTKLAINCLISFFFISMFSLLTTLYAKNYIRKITVQKKNAETEKDRRTRVLSNLSHELRTQINSINGITQLILEKNTLDKTDKEYTQILNYCNNNMLFLVNDLLDIHKIESGKFELILAPKRLDKILHETTLPFINKAKEKNIELISNIDKDLTNIIVNIDASRLIQVIHNLLSNAFKFTNKGSVSFSVELTSETSNNVNILFKVADTGIGISKENFNRIFDSFLQLKTKSAFGGTGLGLTISKTIIEKMDSDIIVESTINKGTTFSFSLDLEKSDTIIESSDQQDVKNFSFEDNTILVVEDNAVSMMYVNNLLTKHHAKTYQATNGLKAIEKVKNHNDIDLILLDLEMPKMNGFEAISHIKKLRPDITVIAFTANVPDQNFLDHLKSLKFDDIISKPFRKKELFLILKKYLKYNIVRSSA